MKYYPGTNPGDDVESYTLEGAMAQSFNCALCSGNGFAPIFRTDYLGKSVEIKADREGKLQQMALRALAYCICPAGRKIMILHENSGSKKLLMPDIHDVIAGKHRGWVVDDPTYDPDEPIDIKALPESLRGLAAKLKAPRIFYPGNGAF